MISCGSTEPFPKPKIHHTEFHFVPFFLLFCVWHFYIQLVIAIFRDTFSEAKLKQDWETTVEIDVATFSAERWQRIQTNKITNKNRERAREQETAKSAHHIVKEAVKWNKRMNKKRDEEGDAWKLFILFMARKFNSAATLFVELMSFWVYANIVNTTMNANIKYEMENTPHHMHTTYRLLRLLPQLYILKIFYTYYDS